MKEQAARLSSVKRHLRVNSILPLLHHSGSSATAEVADMQPDGRFPAEIESGPKRTDTSIKEYLETSIVRASSSIEVLSDE